jgi:hypothetical protein
VEVDTGLGPILNSEAPVSHKYLGDLDILEFASRLIQSRTKSLKSWLEHCVSSLSASNCDERITYLYRI